MRRIRPTVLAVALAALAAPAFAQAVAPAAARLLTKDTFYQMESVQNPRISPDGTQVVFARGYVDVMKDQQASNLWIVDVKGERLRQLTDGAWRDTNPVWAPDGSRIAFVSAEKAGDEEPLYSVAPVANRTRPGVEASRSELAQSGELLKNAPSTKGDYFKVASILE